MLGFKTLTPVFDGAQDVDIEDALARAWMVLKAGAVNLGISNGDTKIDLDTAKGWVADRGYNGEKVFNDNYSGEAREICLRLWLDDMGIASRDLDQQELDSVVARVTVEKSVPPPTFGKVFLQGAIRSVAIGGQSLWLDDVCILERVDGGIFFDDLEFGNTNAWAHSQGE